MMIRGCQYGDQYHDIRSESSESNDEGRGRMMMEEMMTMMRGSFKLALMDDLKHHSR